MSSDLLKSYSRAALKEQTAIFLRSCRPMDSTLAALPCDLLYMVADYLETQDLCNFASISNRNWAILQDTCHKEALRVAGPTSDDYKKFRANRGHGLLTLINMERMNLFWKRRSLLIKAVSYGRLNVAHSFLDHGIDPNSYNIQGKRLLNFAVIFYRLPGRAVANSVRWPLPLGENSSGAYEMIELLLSYGADPSLSDVDDPNTTPLALATESGMSPHVCLLIKNGAYVNQRGVLGKICSSCNMQALQCAIDAGATLDTLRSEGVSLLYLAAENADVDVEILKYLLKAGLGSQVNEVYQGRTPLIRAIETKNQHNILLLLEHGADPNILHQTTNQSALQLACELMLPSASVNALIQAGADLNHEDTFGIRALHVAVIKGQVRTVRAILESGKPFDIAARDLDGHTALDYAMMPGGFGSSMREIIQMLLIAEARARIEDDSS